MNTWIFQADPGQFRIDDFLASSPSDCVWKASRMPLKMRVGDTVFLWRSIGAGDRSQAGVIAKAEISAPVAELRDETPSKDFWLNRSDATEIFDRVAIRFISTGGRIAYDDLSTDPVLSGMSIVKAGIGTNFKLKTDHAERLALLWSKNRKPWCRKEIVEALLAYECKSHHEMLSVKIGRPISDVRRKLASFHTFDPRSPLSSMHPARSQEADIWDEFYDRLGKQLLIAKIRKELETT